MATNIVNVFPHVPEGRRRLNLSTDDINRYINKSLRYSCRLIRDYARTHHRYEDNPARQAREKHIGLTRAIHFRVIDRIKRGEIYINDKEAPYGKYQVEGTKDTIQPTRSKYLSFFSDRYGKWFKKMEVKGLPKDDFIHKAYKANISDVRSIFSDYLRRLLDGRL